MRDHIKISELNNTYLLRCREMKVILPKPRTEFKKKSFSYAGAKIWNDLQENIRYLKLLLLQLQYFCKYL